MTMVMAMKADRSAFDALRCIEGDREFWSARALMPALGYDRWQNFAASIERAKLAAANVGASDAQFREIIKVTGGRPQTDVELSRFAAYLVAMNSDPRKQPVAAAQQYFAVKTREAETATREVPIEKAIESHAAALELAAASIREIALLRPDAEAFRRWVNGGVGARLVAEVGQLLGIGQKRLFRFMRDEQMLINAPGTRRHNAPYQLHINTGRLELRAITHPEAAERHGRNTVFVTPRGAQFIRDRLIRRGIISENGDLRPQGEHSEAREAICRLLHRSAPAHAAAKSWYAVPLGEIYRVVPMSGTTVDRALALLVMVGDVRRFEGPSEVFYQWTGKGDVA